MQKPEGTKMVAEPVRTRMVKVKILSDCIDPSSDQKDPKYLKEGSVVELPEEHAKTLLDFKMTGMYSFSGERFGDESRHVIRRAELTL